MGVVIIHFDPVNHKAETSIGNGDPQVVVHPLIGWIANIVSCVMSGFAG